MKRLLTLAVLISVLTGCAVVQTIKDVWPRAHDPVMVQYWVDTKVALDRVDCDSKPTGWAGVVEPARKLAIYTNFRADPQQANIKGLALHADRMAQGGSPMFCKLGIQTANDRLNIARKAWEGR
jgi:hypothetical protein